MENDASRKSGISLAGRCSLPSTVQEINATSCATSGRINFCGVRVRGKLFSPLKSSDTRLTRGIAPTILPRPRQLPDGYPFGAVRLLASHQGKPGSIPGRVTPNFCKWESCLMMPLVGSFSRGSPVSPAFSFRRCSIVTSFHSHRLSRPRCQEPPKYLNSTLPFWQTPPCLKVNRRVHLYSKQTAPRIIRYTHCRLDEVGEHNMSEEIELLKLKKRRRSAIKSIIPLALPGNCGISVTDGIWSSRGRTLWGECIGKAGPASQCNDPNVPPELDSIVPPREPFFHREADRVKPKVAQGSPCCLLRVPFWTCNTLRYVDGTVEALSTAASSSVDTGPRGLAVLLAAASRAGPPAVWIQDGRELPSLAAYIRWDPTLFGYHSPGFCQNSAGWLPRPCAKKNPDRFYILRFGDECRNQRNALSLAGGRLLSVHPLEQRICDVYLRYSPDILGTTTTCLPPMRTGFDSLRGRPWFSHVGIVPDDVAGRRVSSSGISGFPRPYIPTFAQCQSRFALVSSQDLNVKIRLNLFTHSLLICQILFHLLIEETL
ncbi:hypothetical protein PR048_027688 [Dryococelus australis]|uniref:Uncharacterized protein n=1 Tax=Dryococelus australis TaxID=614101 RepID=A0ABQ9GH63_9NEOP|nr:hypothetical protein PR048_027688 [Dryococelus australis]